MLSFNYIICKKEIIIIIKFLRFADIYIHFVDDL